MEYTLPDLIDIERLRKFLDSFNDAVGISARITTTEGQVIIQSRMQTICREFHRKNEQASSKCIQSDNQMTNEILQRNESGVYRCLNGLTHAVSAIKIEGRHIATLLCGQFLLAPPDMEFFRSQAARYGFEETRYLETLTRVPIVDEKRLPQILSFLASTAAMLGEMGLERLKQRETERSLREAEKRYRIITEYTRDAVWVMDLNLRTTWVTPSVIRNRGYSFEELAAMPMEEHLTPASLKTVTDLIATHLTPENLADRDREIVVNCEVEYICKDGGTIWADTVVKLQRDEAGNPSGFLCSSHNITDWKRTEAALRESEEKYRMIAENVSDIIWTTDTDLNFTYISPSVTRVRGFSVQEAMAQKITESLTPSSLQKALRTNEMEAERLRQNVGTRKGKLTIELEQYRKDGSTVWTENEINYLFGKERHPIGIIGVTRDISQRKQIEAERKSMEERLRRAEKMEALGTLAGGVAHDLNNVLGVLVGYSELLMMEIPERTPLRSYVSDILQSSERAAAIIQDLLTLARRGVAVSKVVNLNDIVSACLDMPEFEKLKGYHPRVTFTFNLGKDLLNVKGSPVHLSKTIMNLVSNAAEAISDRGEVAIVTENRYFDKPIRGYDEMRSGEYAILKVSDTGKGISTEDMGKIFEPFYTKKVMGRSGTGLGLAVVWGTVKDHDGYIDVESSEGTGSIFTISLPVTREGLAVDEKSVSPETYRGRDESILVVDDIKEQRELATNMLGRLGYRVAAATGGEEAVEYLRTNRVDLLVLDMIMEPGIDGQETYRRILEHHPRQKAILVSGFSETERVTETQRLGAGAYVRKPYLLEKIGLAVRKELDKPSS